MKVPKNVGKVFGKVGMRIKHHGPEILMVAGVIGGVAAGVLACKATRHIDEVMEKSKREIDAIHTCQEKGEVEIVEPETNEIAIVEYTDKDAKKDLVKAYILTGGRMIKLYGPSVALGAVSIASIFASNNIMRKRNAALAAAYMVVDKGFKEYRGRVVDRFGEHVDRELKYGIKAKKQTVTEIDPETGKEKKVKKVVETVEDPIVSYARCWDPATSRYSQKTPGYNPIFVKNCERMANDLLTQRGYVYLNEVLDMLGLQTTREDSDEDYGQFIGWIFNKNGHPLGGDNFVDLGLFDKNGNPKNALVEAFMNEEEPGVWLDFNVDGYIADKFRYICV